MGDTIVAGVSGGADSVCLLFVLLEIKKKIDFKLAVVHVNHQIRKEAEEDAEYVRKLCKERGIPFYLTKADVKEYAAEQRISEEEAGRKIRYQAFKKALESECGDRGNGKIAVAHNRNDRAETMLFHLFRGTGLKGLVGIHPVNGNIIRPLISIEREEIEEYLAENHIEYCHDWTNEQDTYTRNRIRHHILPYAEKEICNGAVGHVSRAGEHLQQAEEFIERQVKAAEQRCCRKESVTEWQIHIPDLKKEDNYLQKQILLSVLSHISSGRKDINAKHIDSIMELLDKDGSRELHLPYGILVCKEYDLVKLKIEDAENGVKMDTESFVFKQEECLVGESGKIDVPGLGTVEFAVFSYDNSENIPQKKYTKWFDYDKINQSAVFRRRKAGDYLTINSQLNTKSLQDYLVNQKISKAKRDEMYFLADDSHIIWVPGHRISEYYKVTKDTCKVLEVTVKERLT